MDGVIARWNPEGNWREVGYFLSCKPQKNLIEAIIRGSGYGLDFCILTKVHSIAAAAEKKEWLNAVGLGHIPFIAVPLEESKGTYVEDEASSFLLDDFGQNLHEWRGPSVKWYNAFNGNGGSIYPWSIDHSWDSNRILGKMIEITSNAF